MMHEEKKATKIIEELTMYFLSVGATEIYTGLKKEEERAIITFDSDYHPDYEADLKSMEKYLNEPKNEEMEDIYWELAGSGDPGESSQLLLIGLMTDKVEVEWKEGRVHLTLIKEFSECLY